ncbi:MAG: hypothetical protein UU16_C0017G0002 [Candidatus Woesebacteria bacterium GW2011_GWA2_40_7]|uniref:Uncharacterized protein n=1 Tax=Candidatus Woesebacteria bacterium GW2011_GWA2_40_7 TaxID=1618562 RepID=A0A0G0TFP1_9BACT|nr:MAG: hypothetical protein UU16_C0017G0002 [Candidatus Woesebacteria bacterium GW2011_GWA2_40_7]
MAIPFLPRLETKAAIPRMAPNKPRGNPTQFSTLSNGINEKQTPKTENIPMIMLAIPILFSAK